MAASRVTVSFADEGMRLDTSEDAKVITDKLECEDVEVLILQGNTFNIEAAERVGQYLARQPYLREAHFKDLFTSRGREIVPEALGHLLRGICDSGAELTLLDLSDNAIGPIGAPSVIEFLESASVDKIEKFYINNCGLGPEGSTSIAAEIPRLKSLREFVCGRNRLENKGAKNMSRALSELGTVETLRLNQNGIKPEGILELVDALESNLSSIREVDFSDNTIKKNGSEGLARVISKAPNLRVLKLDDALLENAGFRIICDALSKSLSINKLEHVSFEGNELRGGKIVDLIESVFKKSTQNLTLCLLANEFSPEQLIRLESLKTDSLNILVDELEGDDEITDEEEEEDDDDNSTDVQEEVYDQENGERDDDHSGGSNGFVNLKYESDMREVSQDFIQEFSRTPTYPEDINSAFNQLISTARPVNGQSGFEDVQVLCEELGLMKPEETRKKKPLASDAIIYIGKRLNELPPAFRSFFEVVVKNNDDLGCGKILFEKLEI